MSQKQSFSYKGWIFLGRTSTKLGLMCLAQGYNAVTPMRLEPVAPRSQVKHSSTEPLLSLKKNSMVKKINLGATAWLPYNQISVIMRYAI